MNVGKLQPVDIATKSNMSDIAQIIDQQTSRDGSGGGCNEQNVKHCKLVVKKVSCVYPRDHLTLPKSLQNCKLKSILEERFRNIFLIDSTWLLAIACNGTDFGNQINGDHDNHFEF